MIGHAFRDVNRATFLLLLSHVHVLPSRRSIKILCDLVLRSWRFLRHWSFVPPQPSPTQVFPTHIPHPTSPRSCILETSSCKLKKQTSALYALHAPKQQVASTSGVRHIYSDMSTNFGGLTRMFEVSISQLLIFSLPQAPAIPSNVVAKCLTASPRRPIASATPSR